MDNYLIMMYITAIINNTIATFIKHITIEYQYI